MMAQPVNKMRDLGKLGETTFASWCANEGIACNGAEVDTTGWDYFLELRVAPVKSSRPVHAAGTACQVQVKATDGMSRRWSIALSNLKLLATSPLPVFFIFLEFDSKPVPQKAFLVHLDSAWITKILTRLFKEEKINGLYQNNKNTMSITYGQKQEINIKKSRFLRAAIESYVGDMHTYVEKKKRHLETTGFEGGSGRLSFSTSGAKNLSELVDVFIGAKEYAQVQNFTSYETRFGLRSKEPNFVIAAGTLSLPKVSASDKGVFVIHVDGLPAPLKFECEIFTPPFFERLPSHLRKFRIAGSHFDMVIAPTAEDGYATVSLTKARLTAKVMRDHLCLMKALFSSNKKLNVEIRRANKPNLPLTINARAEEFPLAEELHVLDRVIAILKHYDYIENVPISLSELNRQRHQISAFHTIISMPGLVNLAYSVDKETFLAHQPVVCLLAMGCAIGGHQLGMLLSTQAQRSTPSGNRFTMVEPKVTIEKLFSADPGEGLDDSVLDSYFDEASQRFEGIDQIVRMTGYYRGEAPSDAVDDDDKVQPKLTPGEAGAGAENMAID